MDALEARAALRAVSLEMRTRKVNHGKSTSPTTIRLPKKLLADWLAALRGGEYQQGRGRLERDGNYCCLGVLEVVADGGVERFGTGDAVALPTIGWLLDHGVEFLDTRGKPAKDPIVWDARETLSGMNDTGISFERIAALIEEAAEGVE